MSRLILTWAVITAIITVLKYIVDRQTKEELGKWSLRIMWSGIVTATFLAFIVFLERL